MGFSGKKVKKIKPDLSKAFDEIEEIVRDAVCLK